MFEIKRLTFAFLTTNIHLIFGIRLRTELAHSVLSGYLQPRIYVRRGMHESQFSLIKYVWTLWFLQYIFHWHLFEIYIYMIYIYMSILGILSFRLFFSVQSLLLAFLFMCLHSLFLCLIDRSVNQLNYTLLDYGSRTKHELIITLHLWDKNTQNLLENPMGVAPMNNIELHCKNPSQQPTERILRL